MRRILNLGVLVICCNSYLSAQITFQKTYGGFSEEEGHSVQQTSDGGYILVGFTTGFGAAGENMYLVKTDAFGNALWNKTYGGANFDISEAVRQTSDGGYIITGLYGLSSNFSDVYIIKADSNGDTLWTKTFGDLFDDYGTDVQQTADGGYIFAGNNGNNGPGMSGACLIRTDANGDSLWTKSYGGPAFDWSTGVEQTTDGGFIVGGTTTSFGAGHGDFYLIKTDGNGDTLWTKTYGGVYDEYCYAVQQTTDGGYILAGEANSFGSGFDDVYLVKTDSSGNMLWSKTYGGMSFEMAKSVRQTTDSGFIIAGSTNSFGGGNSDVYLIKTDANGNAEWSKTYGGPDGQFGNAVWLTSDNGFAILGSTMSFSPGDRNMYLIKTDSMGNSGCNEANAGTVVISPATIVTSPATIVSSGTFVAVPSCIIGNGGTFNTVCTSVGLYEFENGNTLLIMPNPSRGFFNISFNSIIKSGIIEIINSLGEIIISENISNEFKKEFNSQNLPGGIYFVKVIDDNKQYCNKIIIESY